MTSTPTRLLAKSYDRQRYSERPPDYALLTQHSRDVAIACSALAQRVGPRALDVCGLDRSHLHRLTEVLRLNGWIQDLGKANSHFQAMVSGQPEIRQMVRHETISGLLPWLDPRLRGWLSPIADALLPAIWGALGHHRKFDDQTRPDVGAALTVHVAHPDFAAILQDLAHDLGLPPPPSFERDFSLGSSKRDGADHAAGPLLYRMIDEFRQAEGDYHDETARRLLALIKGFGIAADVVASAVARPRSGQRAASYSIAGFIEQGLSVGLTVSDLDALVRRWAWDHYEQPGTLRDETQLPPGFQTRPFQDQVAESSSLVTLAEAGCGSGKSLAAYLWARRWCERRTTLGCQNFRMFFCLPTTGTTTEHYKDYALESGIPASLAHSRAQVDLHTLAQTADQEEIETSEPQRQLASSIAAAQALHAERQKIEALALWAAPIVVTTADTVLGLMANALRPLCSLPALVQSGIVFDEVHAFDDHLFGHLLVFLKNFPGLPVLLMTASLPAERRRALLQVRPDLAVVAGPPDLEELERYLCVDGDEDLAWLTVEQCWFRSPAAKILWVRNRVDWANDTFARARERFPGKPIDVYHSRFRYKDRSARHRRVIDRFKRKGEPALLVATQVAEMSLDLSADLLITDEAPVPSLIQRLGRLNRSATPQRPSVPNAVVVSVGSSDELPYAKETLGVSREWRGSLSQLHRALSQRDLAVQFESLDSAAGFDYKAAEENAYFFGVPDRSGLWRTRPGKTRGDGYTIAVLLGRDVAGLGAKEPDSGWLRAHEVSIPFRQSVIGWSRRSGAPVAPKEAIAYDYDEATREGTGAQWCET
jgi:CRISPR-associated endonuclease/helicase Cas3